MADAVAPLKVFISFASEDDGLREELVQHLAQLERDGLIESWHGREIGAGEDWAGQIDERLEAADIVLLLVSPAFLHSRYCYDIEMRRALERHAAGQAHVIPVILRPADWQTAPFARLQALPSYVKPAVSWASRDEAFLDVAKGLRRTVAEIRAAASADPAGILPSSGSAEPVLTPVPEPKPPVVERASHATPESLGQDATSVPRVKAKRTRALALILAPTALLGLAALASSNWRVATPLTFDLAVDRVAFIVGGAAPIGLPERALDFRELTVEDFDQASVGSTRLTGVSGERSELTITAARADASQAGRLESIALEPGARVILEASRAEAPTLTVRVYGRGFHTRVSPAGPIEVRVVGAAVNGDAQATSSSAPLVLRPVLASDTPYVELEGARRSFAIIVTPRQPDNEALAQRVPITQVEFDKEDTYRPAGSSGGVAGPPVKSSVVGESRGEYAGVPALGAIILNPGDVLELADLRNASLTRLRLSPEGFIRLGVDGVFGKVYAGAPGAAQDWRFTAFDRLWHGSRPAVVLALLVWLACVLVGANMLRRGGARSE